MKIYIFGLILALFSTLSTAMPILDVNAGGSLVGARNVPVSGTLYDVVFSDGSCTEVYGSCDTASFTFQSEAEASLASQALLERVFIDNALGLFDSVPSLTFGCSAINTQCSAVTPYLTNGNPLLVQGRMASNQPGGTGFVASFSEMVAFSDLTNVSERVWARWSLAAPIPEPTSLALMGLGIAGLGVRRKFPRRHH